VVSIGERLVGRAETCGAFDDALSELDGGRSAALALVGEPGIGKTRLLAELAARADARGQLVLYGSASELERDLPSASVQKPITRSTPARLYQERSKRTISPAAGRCAT
jgi:DNA replication protein DnaC